MKKVSDIRSYLRVMCEGCIKESNPDCPACRGARFYLWDPETSFCFTERGEQIFYTDDLGETIPVIRRQACKATRLSTEVMLEFIESWVSQLPVRKWKLLLDENGWESCVWFHRYKHSCVQISEHDFNKCVQRTYEEIQKRQAPDLRHDIAHRG